VNSASPALKSKYPYSLLGCDNPLHLKSGMSQLIKNQMPIYEIISGAALAFAALLLILPGFATDIIGFLLIFPPTRKLLLKKVSNNYSNKNNKKQDFINGDFEDIDEDKDEKL